MESFRKLIEFQASGVKITKYENEFATMTAVHDHPAVVADLLRLQTLEWIKSVTPDLESKESRNAESTQLRKEGNKLFQRASKQNALEACQLYTRAIFAAPLGEALALAHANRALALQKFGYFQQAYDDCECALEQGYPQSMRHKLWTRQAFCAAQLKDVLLLKKHLDALGAEQLNKEFITQIEELTQGLESLQVPEEKEIHINCTEQVCRKKTQILKHDTCGRYMVTTDAINENELIFSECATSFVPIGVGELCQMCAATLFIPFPCYHCRGKVAYCSLKCKHAHQGVHRYECVAYQHNLFAHVGIGHLALRLVLDNAAHIATRHSKTSSAELIWRELTEKEFLGLYSTLCPAYFHTLCLVTHLDKMSMSDVLCSAIVSAILVLYLSEFTDFFLNFSESAANRSDWELVIGSLILRHIGQLVVNGHSCFSICRNRTPKVSDQIDFDLMSTSLWESPWHVRLGHLHEFRDFAETTAANLPYLSMCNHACSQSFQLRYSGRCISTFATKPIKAGDQVFNCYYFDYRKSRKSIRWNVLKETYHFACECPQCSKLNPDEDYEKFHRFRCDQPKCHQEFTLEPLSCDNLWELLNDVNTNEVIKCPICNTKQRCHERHSEYAALLKRVRSREARKKLYKYFDFHDVFLVDYNELKLIYALQTVTACFEAHVDGFSLEDDDFTKLSKLLKMFLRGVALQTSANSLEYVSKMTYLWDFIALGKYKPTRAEMTEMLQAVEIVSDEIKVVFQNYYADNINNKL